MRICSIDIGTKNCAFYIEEFDESEFASLKKKFNLQKFYQLGKRVYWKVINFEKDIQEHADIFIAIGRFLDSNRHEWDKCSGIVIEKQMKINFNAQVIQHFIFSYFKNLYGSFKYISDIHATRKTQVLDAPKKMTKPERKKWAIDEAVKVFSLREDYESLKILLSSKKADDLADCCIQLKAFQKLVFILGMTP